RGRERVGGRRRHGRGKPCAATAGARTSTAGRFDRTRSGVSRHDGRSRRTSSRTTAHGEPARADGTAERPVTRWFVCSRPPQTPGLLVRVVTTVRRTGLAVAGLVCLTALVAAQAPEIQTVQEPNFRGASSEIVVLPLVVSDPKGRMVAGLSADR